jgi:hypothetical protein
MIVGSADPIGPIRLVWDGYRQGNESACAASVPQFAEIDASAPG